jgi:hypothetical protein
MRKDEHIPQNVKLIFVADFFIEDLVGGAELTHDAILQKCPAKFVKIHSSSVTVEMVEQNTDKHWLLGNFSKISRAALIEIANTTKFSIIECDYLYCTHRSSHLHKLQTGNDCDCHVTDSGRFIQGLFKRSQGVSFMSQGQMNEYLRLFPRMKGWPEGKLRVQGSTFSDDTLDSLIELAKSPKRDICAVLGGGSWIKNQAATEAYCKANKLAYELVQNPEPRKFLEQLSTCRTLVFHPAGFDTAPRITMEAKLMGLGLDLNENVQHKDDGWFVGSRENAEKHLRALAKKYWKEGLIL